MFKVGVTLKGLGLLLCLILSTAAFGQNFILKPASVEGNNGTYKPKMLLSKSSEFRVSWTQLDQSTLNLSGTGSKLVIGRSANTYNAFALDVSGSNTNFIPDDIGLAPGRYYARVTNSSARTISEIQADQQSNSDIVYSNEILLLVEADEAPSIIEPRGSVTNATPTFQWSAVSGVPSYWLIVSSTPFDIVEDEDGNIAIEGATIVWQYITKNTNGTYGDINFDSPFTVEAPPLNPGEEYSYTVLNVYENNNPVFTSPVFGGIVPFTYVDPNAVPKATLTSPANNAAFISEETITFSWNEVAQAQNYTANLMQLVKQQGIDVTVPIWSSTTTNNLIEYPAIDNLKNGRYQWNVISNNASGGGTTSSSRYFTYEVETGEFNAQIKSAVDNSTILGVELTARAVSDGVSPVLPYFVQNSSHADSLVVGTYAFTAVKEGFEDGEGEVTIRDGRTSNITLNMTPLPSSLNGVVADENGETVENASVALISVSTGEEEVVVSDVNGEFSVSLNEGSYTIEVSKSGYIGIEDESITLELNEQKTLATPLQITNDQATVSGYIFNDEGNPVQRATVAISDGTKTYEVKSNGLGVYQFTVSSGEWTISVEKVGFVKPSNETVSLSTGDILQNQDFTLTGNANQITGFVRERTTNEDGTTGNAAFANITVTAIPNVGEPIVTTSEINGQYNLSLKSGSYTILAEEDNYTSNEDRDLVIGIAIGETISGMDFELIPNPSSISGTVVLPNGNGVQGASVTINGVGTVLTSSSGFYELSVPEGSHLLSVSKTGLVSPSPKTVSVTVGQELTGVDFQMTPNAGTVSGKITSGGEPLSNTKVTAINATNGNRTEITNNLNGNFSINLSSGNWYIKATKSGFISDSTGVISVGPGQQVVNQNLILTKNQTTVRGTVTDGATPLRNASVTVTGANSFNQSTVTQVSGTYAFTIPAGTNYTIETIKDGYRTSTTSTEVLSAGTTIVKDFSLPANPSSVKGSVKVSGGVILGSAKVVAVNSAGTRVDSTRTKTDGTYLLGLDPGSYTLIASKAGYTKEQNSTTLSIGQNLSGINFEVDENFALFSGTITDASGNGIEQVFINLIKASGGGASSTTDQDGSFSIAGQIGGIFTIEISKSGYVSKTLVKTVNDGAYVSVNESLTPKNGTISGTATDENGLVLADATVTATSTSGAEYTAITEADGGYTITSVEIASYTVNASKTGYTTNVGVTTEITEEELNSEGVNVTNLTPNNGVIQGSVTNFSTSSGIKSAQVSAVGTRGSGLSISTSSGSYVLSNLIPDTYQVITAKDGYKSDTTSVVIDPATPTSTSNASLIQNNGIISGIITDPDGSVLPFRVSVLASNSEVSKTTLTNDSGEFSFEGIETGSTYLISTDIYREGYENVETELVVPLGASETVVDESIEVSVRQGTISGDAGIDGASVTLIDANTQEIVEIVTSNQDGDYTFDFLEAGSYQVAAKKLGYVFTPTTSGTLTLTFDGTQNQNFSAVANIGTIAVLVQTDGKGISNVDVSIVSSDTSVVLAAKTGAGGKAVFSDIKAGTAYSVRPSKEGFSATPISESISLSSGDSSTVTFQLVANSSALNGTVAVGTSALSGADIRAVLTSTGQSKSATSASNGSYSLSGLAPGNYKIVASKTGYTTDSLAVTISAGETVAAEELVLEKASVRIAGKVLFKGAGVKDVTVTAVSSATLETKTNTSGNFAFSNLAIKTGATDTTVYQVKISTGVFSKSYLLEITSDKIGKTINLGNTNLPSGQILLTVTDGIDPLDGAKLEFGISGGESEQIVTGTDGAFTSDETLRKATYVVAVSKSGLLVPQNTIKIVLPNDTTILNREVILPYRLKSITQILADASTNVSVINKSGYDNTRSSGILYYKRDSETQFNQVPMTLIGDTLRAQIPALFSTEEVSYYTTITDTSRNNTYISSQKSIVPLGSGILTNVRVTPSINGQTLRVGETYSLTVTIRDGINKTMGDRFSGSEPEGEIIWEDVSQSEDGVQLLNQEGTTIQLKPELAGNYVVKVSATLDGSQVSRNLEIGVTDIPLESISVSTPAKQLANSEEHLFSYSAVDTTGESVLLGSSLSWQVVPSNAGTVDDRGLFTPTSSSLFGTFAIVASDSISQLSGTSETTELVARVEPDETYTLHNGLGLELNLPEGSVDIPSLVSLKETKPADTKKYVFAQNTDQSYTVGDRIYILSFSGSSLKKTAELTLPEDSTISDLHTGEREIGRFNFTTLQWELFDGGLSKTFTGAAGTISTNRLGQFAVLATNEPLGLTNAAVLPSPFSPDIAPVKIGYWLDTSFPPAIVTIQIFNIRGELVRTLLEDDIQLPGRYGSTSSNLEILWDGLTDEGNMARNGRYIIQITAKDQQDEVVELLQVVLIK